MTWQRILGIAIYAVLIITALLSWLVKPLRTWVADTLKEVRAAVIALAVGGLSVSAGILMKYSPSTATADVATSSTPPTLLIVDSGRSVMDTARAQTSSSTSTSGPVIETPSTRSPERAIVPVGEGTRFDLSWVPSTQVCDATMVCVYLQKDVNGPHWNIEPLSAYFVEFDTDPLWTRIRLRNDHFVYALRGREDLLRKQR